MPAEAFTVLGVAVSVLLAAIAALWKLVILMTKLDSTQTEYRHRLRAELTSVVLQCEDRLSRRIEILEQTSFGFNRHKTRGSDDTDNWR